jgi:hypothetical protein
MKKIVFESLHRHACFKCKRYVNSDFLNIIKHKTLARPAKKYKVREFTDKEFSEVLYLMSSINLYIMSSR